MSSFERFFIEMRTRIFAFEIILSLVQGVPGVNRPWLVRFLGAQDTLNYLTTYLANLPIRPKYLGYLKKKTNYHWVSVVRALCSAVCYYCIRINWKNIGKTSWENMRIINKKPEDPGFVCFIDVCNKSTMYSSMTQLLSYTITHFTRPSFML